MPDELKYYAEYLIKEHAYDIESLTIHEMSTFFLGRDLTDDEFEQVDSLLDSAIVTVEFRSDND